MTPHTNPPRRPAARRRPAVPEPASASTAGSTAASAAAVSRRVRLPLSKVTALPARWIVPVAVLAGALAGGTYGMLRTPQYSATSYVVVVPTEKSDPAAALGFATAYGRVATQVALIGDAPVWAGVPARTLRESVRTATSPDAPMISVTATSDRASTAVNMADGVARALVVNGSHLQGSTRVRVLQFSRAVEPAAPVTPSAGLSALVGGCAGGLLGGLGLLVRPKPRRGEFHANVPGPATSDQPHTQPHAQSQAQSLPQSETV
ncbi:lipopolysaccharide biosynthesis protein [Streptomyces sp. NPDC094034]|uniref:lipopolysaccharide biosynthesis protein n=1 Tax=Streptomyces sp. NPDC094034 TaxID=3155309 RepID=UPI0033176DF4